MDTGSSPVRRSAAEDRSDVAPSEGPYRRIVVIGGPGSGKTTFAAAVAARLALPHVELDALWWEAGWKEAAPEVFARRVRQATGTGRWVIDGNYWDHVAPGFWPLADAVIWLDLPRHVCVRRAVGRSLSRVLLRRELWSGNRERPSTLGPASIARFVRRWPVYPERIAAFWHAPRSSGPEHVRLSSPTAVRRWLTGLGRPGGCPP